MLDEETIACARLKCALKSAFLRVSGHLFALLLAFGRLDSRLPMRFLALTRAKATVADALDLVVGALGGARCLIVLQLAPNIRVVTALGMRQRRLQRLEEAIGVVEQLAGAFVRRVVAVEDSLKRARVCCKYKLQRVERVEYASYLQLDRLVFIAPFRQRRRKLVLKFGEWIVVVYGLQASK